MRLLAVAAALLLAACDGGKAPPEQQETVVPPATSDLASARAPSHPDQSEALDSRDCRTVAAAYSDAIARRDFTFAALVWDDPVIDDARLAALFNGYATPRIEIADIRQEGAAGSLYCTVTGALTDAGDPAKVPRQGEIVLKRVNDVPGATAEQLRWTIRASTFVEPMERSGKGDPA